MQQFVIFTSHKHVFNVKHLWLFLQGLIQRFKYEWFEWRTNLHLLDPGLWLAGGRGVFAVSASPLARSPSKTERRTSWTRKHKIQSSSLQEDAKSFPKRYKEKWSSGICLNNPEGHCHTHWTARRSWRCPPASGGWRCPCSTSGGWRAEPWWRPEPAGGGPAAPAPSLHPGCVSARSESGSTAGSWALWCSDAQPGRLRGKDTRHVRQTSCCSKSDPSNIRSSVFSVSYCQVCLWAARCSWCRYRRWSVEVCGGRWSRRAPPSGSCSNQPAAHTTTAPGPPPAPPSSWTPPEPHPETTKQVCLTVGSKRILIEYLFICQLVKETD